MIFYNMTPLQKYFIQQMIRKGAISSESELEVREEGTPPLESIEGTKLLMEPAIFRDSIYKEPAYSLELSRYVHDSETSADIWLTLQTYNIMSMSYRRQHLLLEIKNDKGITRLGYGIYAEGAYLESIITPDQVFSEEYTPEIDGALDTRLLIDTAVNVYYKFANKVRDAAIRS